MNRKIDKTSIVMIGLFVAIIVGAILGCVIAVKVSRIELNENATPVVEQTPQKKLYETPEELVEEFKNVCAQGDIERLYELYYDDYLELMRQNMENPPEKDVFDDNMIQNMMSVMGVDIYMYGDIELPATQPPSSYASYIFARVNNGMEMPIKPELIEDCANLVVYAGGIQNNHFIIKVDGAWYFIV